MKVSLSLKLKQILVIMIAILVTSSAVSLIIGFISVKRLRIEIENNLTSYSDQLANSYATWLEKELVQLASFGEYLDLDYSDPALYEATEREIKRLGYMNIKPVDLQGQLYLSPDKTVDISQRKYIQKILKDHVPAISDPVFSVLEGQEDLLTIPLAAPIFRNGKLAGIIAGQREATFLSDNIDMVSYRDGSTNFVLNEEGTTIAHTDFQMVVNAVNPLDMAKENPDLADLGTIAADMILGHKGVGIYTFQGIEKIVAYAPVPGTAWSAAIAVDTKEAFETIKDLRTSSIVILMIVEIIGVFLALFLGRSLVRPILILNNAIREIASGDADLTKKIPLKRSDEIGELAQGVNRFIEKLHSIIWSLKNSQSSLADVGNELSSTSQETASAVNQIMANIAGIRKQAMNQAEKTSETSRESLLISNDITKLDDMINDQVDCSTEASSVVEEMIANVNEVGRSVERMALNSKELTITMKDNREKQDAMDKRVGDISSQSELLFEANKVISGIASQTNLLAMNAAIEAAHAGHAGRGFSVVADEIRKLAETSAIQSQRISTELGQIQESIKDVVEGSNNSQQAFEQLSSRIDELEGLINQVDLAMKEQGEGSKQVLSSLGSLSRISHDVKGEVDDIKKRTITASQSMETLIHSSKIIEGGMSEMAMGAQEINQASVAVSDLANSTNQSIHDMDKQIGKFHV